MFESNRLALRVEATDGDTPAVGIAQAFQNLDGGGFASAVWPQEAENFAFFHVEADVADGFDVAVTLYEILNLKNRSWHRFLPRTPGIVRERIAYSTYFTRASGLQVENRAQSVHS